MQLPCQLTSNCFLHFHFNIESSCVIAPIFRVLIVSFIFLWECYKLYDGRGILFSLYSPSQPCFSFLGSGQPKKEEMKNQNYVPSCCMFSSSHSVPPHVSSTSEGRPSSVIWAADTSSRRQPFETSTKWKFKEKQQKMLWIFDWFMIKLFEAKYM